ncbi:MAG TPA: c-type cytochrome biogenesis protein CcsB [Streptosporangiaceae bacterium]
MPINYGLANLSHDAFMVTVVAYALAVLAFAGDFAFGREVLGQLKPAQEPATDRVAVGVSAGAPAASAITGPPGVTGLAGVTGPADGDGEPGAPPTGAVALQPGSGQDSRAMGRWVQVALVFTALGLAAHVLGVVSRGLAVHRVPWGDMYEFVTTVTCVAVAVFVAFMVRYRAYRLGLFVLGPVVVLLGIAETVIYTPAGQLPPALQSYWLAIHVTSITLATGAFVVAALLAVSYLLADRHAQRAAAGLRTRGDAIFRLLPASTLIDRLAYRTVVFGFPLWTFGIIAGAIWADEAWGRYWGWDPTETWAFITWVVYAGYLHARATAGWRGRRSAYIMLIGFGCLLFNTIVVSLLIKGLHSYAGLS